MKKSELRQFIKESISEVMSEAPQNPQGIPPNANGPYPQGFDPGNWVNSWIQQTLTPYFDAGNLSGALNFVQQRISMWTTRMNDMDSGTLFDNQLAFKIDIGQQIVDYFGQIGMLEEKAHSKIKLPQSFFKAVQAALAKMKGRPAMGKPAMGRPAMGKPKAIRPAAGKPRM